MVALIKEEGPAEVFTFGSRDYNLTKEADVVRMSEDQRSDIVIHLAARVGGIGANRENPGRFFYDNAIMGLLLMEQACQHGTSKFVQVGTVCAYPKFTAVPFKEEDLWNGYPEETNAPYGIAKKAPLVQAQAYRARYKFNAIYLLPANLYGPGGQFRSGLFTCDSVFDPQVRRGPRSKCAKYHRLGDGHPNARVSVRGRRGKRNRDSGRTLWQASARESGDIARDIDPRPRSGDSASEAF